MAIYATAIPAYDSTCIFAMPTTTGMPVLVMSQAWTQHPFASAVMLVSYQAW